MSDAEKVQKRAVAWRERGWTYERIAEKLGLQDRRFAFMAVKRGRAKGFGAQARA